MSHDDEVYLKSLPFGPRDLRRVRSGFWLLLASLAAQLLLIILFLSVGSDAEPGTPRPPEQPIPLARWETMTALGGILAVETILVAIVVGFHYPLATTRRWRQALVMLLVTFLAEGGFALASVYAAGDVLDPKLGQPVAARVCGAMAQLLGVAEYWWIVVVIAEFALACGIAVVARQAEYLSYAVMTAAVILTALVAWTTPDPLVQEDDVTLLLMGLAQLAMFVLLLWTMNMLGMSASIAGVLGERMSAPDAPAKIRLFPPKPDEESFP